jgi:peptidyl-tRNA hydrolase
MSDTSVAIMNLVVRVERGAPPQRTDALEAAAAASVRAWLATEDSSSSHAASTALVAKWKGGPRKIVRRARGHVWRQASDLADTKVTVGTAEVLGFKVCEVGETPVALRGMQVSGLELDDPDDSPEPADGSPVIWLNPHLPMTTGKAMAQAGHGAILAWERASELARSEWLTTGLKIGVRVSPTQSWPLHAGHRLVVTDEGYTEVMPGSVTAAVALPGGFASGEGQGTREPVLVAPQGRVIDGP